MEEGFQRDFDEIGRVGWPTLRLIFYALPLCVFATLREIFSPLSPDPLNLSPTINASFPPITNHLRILLPPYAHSFTPSRYSTDPPQCPASIRACVARRHGSLDNLLLRGNEY